MAFDQTKPATTDNYSTQFTQGIQANFLALAMWLDSTNATIIGTVPTYAKRYNRTSKFIEEYSGSAWGTLLQNISGNAATATTAAACTGNAGTATAVAVINDVATVTSVYPLFVSSTSGNWGARVANTKMSFVPSTGILTCIGFAGALTGNVTGNVSGTAANITGTAAIANGGTGATTAAAARDNLGIDTSNVAQEYVAFTSTGAAPNFVLTPTPALAAYAANQRYRVKFNVAGSGANAINVSGLGAKLLKQYNSAGAKIAAVIAASQLADVEYDGTDFIILDPLPVTISDASTSVKGEVQLATLAEVQAGTNALKAVTPSTFAGAGFGVNQTWQDMTASRAANTTYTNSTGRPIQIIVSWLCSGGGFPFLNVNGVRVCKGSDMAGGLGTPVTAVVPNGGTYLVNNTSGGSITANGWQELR